MKIHFSEEPERADTETAARMKGWRYDAIAIQLGMNPNTVKIYRNRAMKRLRDAGILADG